MAKGQPAGRGRPVRPSCLPQPRPLGGGAAGPDRDGHLRAGRDGDVADAEHAAAAAAASALGIASGVRAAAAAAGHDEHANARDTGRHGPGVQAGNVEAREALRRRRRGESERRAAEQREEETARGGGR